MPGLFLHYAPIDIEHSSGNIVQFPGDIDHFRNNIDHRQIAAAGPDYGLRRLYLSLLAVSN